MELSPGYLHKLAELLTQPEQDVLQGEDFTPTRYEITSTKDNAGARNTKKVPTSIEEYEQQEAEEMDLLSKSGGGVGDRKTPSYTMNYQQSVGAEDIFLQIGHKTPSSASCENLIVRIKMPGDKMENIDLSVETTRVTVDSSQYHLKFSPPHPVDPDRSKANWDAAEETLILTLKLDREFDFVNF
ncbi:dynein axonemal assembly factor 6 [Aricia agestis]|uniref:dynein axonemal assembly factor 6 n=1 Tax=Aricia agestis TaxID=91739 RepID=UPI001C206781|nr:dynein axonemal assembly factor 6 [Aricia agestis]